SYRHQPPGHIAQHVEERRAAEPTEVSSERDLAEGGGGRHDAANRIDERTDTAVGRAHEKAPLLDRAELRERQMDPRLGRVAEPGVVRQVHEQARRAVAHDAVHEAPDVIYVADEGGDGA